MSRSFFINLILGGLMACSAIAAKLMTPTLYLSKSLPELNLNTIIPTKVGDWSEEKNAQNQVINPQSLDFINKIYTKTLSRTYVNDKGERIMLSIAYGADQRDSLQVHYPDVCYPAQGFELLSKRRDNVASRNGNIPVVRLETNYANQRFEPVTYWTTVGNEVVTSRLDKKVAEMRYAFKGKIPDGLIFRVSSIDRDSVNAFRIQNSFINSMVSVLKDDEKIRLMGIR
jgi:EpsI family protein